MRTVTVTSMEDSVSVILYTLGFIYITRVLNRRKVSDVKKKITV